MNKLFRKFFSILFVPGLLLCSQVSWATSNPTAEGIGGIFCVGDEDFSEVADVGCPVDFPEDSQKYIGETEKNLGAMEKGVMKSGWDMKGNKKVW